MLSNLQYLGLYDTKISGTIPREIWMLSNLQQLLMYNTQISAQSDDAEQFAAIVSANTKISGSIPRDIDAELSANIAVAQHANQWHNSSRDIDAEQFAGIAIACIS